MYFHLKGRNPKYHISHQPKGKYSIFDRIRQSQTNNFLILQMRIFLTIKHWQVVLLFLLFTFLPGFLTGYFEVARNFLKENIDVIPTLYIGAASIVGYLYSFSIFTQLIKKKSVDVDLKDYLFHLYFFLNVGCSLVSLVLIKYFGIFNIVSSKALSHHFLTLQFSSPLYWISLISNIYICYFLAKLVKGVELGEEPPFRQTFIGTLSFLFMPFGVFYIQPKLNRIQRSIDEGIL